MPDESIFLNSPISTGKRKYKFRVSSLVAQQVIKGSQQTQR